MTSQGLKPTSSNIIIRDALDLYNRNLSLEYLTGYLIEYSLSVDNIFVIIMIFLSFNIQSRYYHKVLFWGILGAIVMRFVFIFAASALIQRFEGVLYLFGAFLILIGTKMGWEFFSKKEEEKIDPHNHQGKWKGIYYTITDSTADDRIF